MLAIQDDYPSLLMFDLGPIFFIISLEIWFFSTPSTHYTWLLCIYLSCSNQTVIVLVKIFDQLHVVLQGQASNYFFEVKCASKMVILSHLSKRMVLLSSAILIDSSFRAGGLEAGAMVFCARGGRTQDQNQPLGPDHLRDKNHVQDRKSKLKALSCDFNFSSYLKKYKMFLDKTKTQSKTP